MLKSERLIIRPLEEDDMEMIRQWRNKHRDDFFDAGEISKEQQRLWYTHYKESGGKDQMFIICLKDGTPIGQVAIYDVNIENRTAKFGRFLLLEEFRGQSYAEEAVKRLLKHCFDTMRLYKLKLEVFLENINAIAIYARAGFKTTTKPIIMLEKINDDYDYRKPLQLTSYDDMAGDAGYESQCTNIKE